MIDSITQKIMAKAELLCNSSKLYKPGLTGALPVYRYWGDELPQFESKDYGNEDSCLEIPGLKIGPHQVWKRVFFQKSGETRNQEFYVIPGLDVLEEAENIREECEINFAKLLRCLDA